MLVIMDLQRGNDGHWRFHLGPVEKWIVVVVAAAFVSGGYWMVASINAQMNAQNVTLQEVKTQQAVTNAGLGAIAMQLADVPSIRGQVTELKVRVEMQNESIKELKANKGLR